MRISDWLEVAMSVLLECPVARATVTQGVHRTLQKALRRRVGVSHRNVPRSESAVMLPKKVLSLQMFLMPRAACVVLSHRLHSFCTQSAGKRYPGLDPIYRRRVLSGATMLG